MAKILLSVKIILLLAVLMVFTKCHPEPLDSSLKYTIKNNSVHDIDLGIFKAYFMNSKIKDTIIKINSNKEVYFEFFNKGGQEPFGMSTDSAYIIFSNKRQIIYKRDDGQARNVLDINSWNGGKEKEGLYRYQYFISDEDYDNAIEID